MKRVLRKRLAAALRQPHPESWWQTTCRLRLPAAWGATAPVWSPGPGYLEVDTAQVWAMPADGHTAHAVVLCRHDTKSDTPVLCQADVSIRHVIGAGGLCDKPHRIRWMAINETLSTTSLTRDHPVLAYNRWCHQLADQLYARLAGHRYDYGVGGGNLELDRAPNGGFQATTEILVDPDWYHYDITSHAATLASLARLLGTGTRLQFFDHDDDPELDPLYHHARRQLLDHPTDRAA